MNKRRRKEIADIAERLQSISTEIEETKEMEDEYYEAMPENFQMGEKGTASETASDALDSAMCMVDEAVEYLQQAGE